MAELKKYKRFGLRYLLANIVLFIPLVILFVIAWSRWEKMDAVFWISVTLFIIGVIIGLVWDIVRLRNFHCPKCGKLITDPKEKERKEGEPINYYCSECDIEWETGLIKPSMD